MTPTLYLTLQKISSPDRLSGLTEQLRAAFPAPENQAYLQGLWGKDARPATALPRLSALSLLPSLLAAAGIPAASLRLMRDGHGRPYAQGSADLPPFDFNLSHSSSYVACGLLVGGGRVGVDVEGAVDPARAEGLIRRFCTEGERRLLDESSDAADTFTRIWTVREALGKAEGQGMPLRFDAANPPHGVTLRSAPLPTGGWLTVCHPSVPTCMEVLPSSLPISWI